jgi:hypothetical protein
MRTRKNTTVKPVVVSQMAIEEQQAWEIERQQRFALRPIGHQPAWVDHNNPWLR